MVKKTHPQYNNFKKYAVFDKKRGIKQAGFA